ncbi:MAG: NUDIX hydrolase [Candidatus Komeilibacteria bacterium]|nr:NUDIX hydrolase [Candidatus Komeilibacteria bacterium]
MSKPYQKFKFVAAATDVVIFSLRGEALNVLLIKMKKKPYQGKWALPGGMVKISESVEKAARRHLQAKTGVSDIFLEQLYAFGGEKRDPYGRVLSVAYYALLPYDKSLMLKTTAEYADVRWWPVAKLPALAYDHAEILKTGVKRLRSKLGYTNIVYSLLPRQFTLSELQKVYEIILDQEIDKRNFRKKVGSLGLVKTTGKKRRGEANRPAALFEFTSRSLAVVNIL